METRRDYYQEVRLLPHRGAAATCAVVLAALVLLPLLVPRYELYMVNTMLVNVVVAVGLNLLVGFTGQVSLGHAGFVAVGAYATVLLITRLGLPAPLALLGAGLLTAVFGLLLGLPALRLDGPYLAIATLGFGMTVIQIIGRRAFFGGHMGLQVPKPALFGFVPQDDLGLYYLMLPVVVLLVLMARNLTRTRVGRAFQAVRDSPTAARALGVHVAWYKALAFAVSAFYAGVAGGFWAFSLGYINPSMFDFFLSILFLAMVVLGGVGSHTGAVLGAVVVTWLNLKLDNVGDWPLIGAPLQAFTRAWMHPQGLPNLRFLVFGLLFIGLVLWEPLGLNGVRLRLQKRLQRRRAAAP